MSWRGRASAARPAMRDDARALLDLARALGARLAETDEELLARNPARILASDQAYAAPLPEAERRALVDDDDDAPLGELLALLGEIAPLLCPGAAAALADSELAGAERLSGTSLVAAVATYPQIAKALGGPPILLHATTRRGAGDVTLLLAAPPVVVLGPRLASRRAASHAEVDPEADAELRFWLGRTVELSRVHRCLAAGVSPERFARFIEALRWAVTAPDDKPSIGRAGPAAAAPATTPDPRARPRGPPAARRDPAAAPAPARRAARPRSAAARSGGLPRGLRAGGRSLGPARLRRRRRRDPPRRGRPRGAPPRAARGVAAVPRGAARALGLAPPLTPAPAAR